MILKQKKQLFLVAKQICKERGNGVTLWKSMGHPQFISLYRQEVNIDFLLRFFHRQEP